MKTFAEACGLLVTKGNPTNEMDRYRAMCEEILRSEEMDDLADAFIDGFVEEELSLRQLVRYVFGQGVITGIEMEKP